MQPLKIGRQRRRSKKKWLILAGIIVILLLPAAFQRKTLAEQDFEKAKQADEAGDTRLAFTYVRRALWLHSTEERRDFALEIDKKLGNCSHAKRIADKRLQEVAEAGRCLLLVGDQRGAEKYLGKFTKKCAENGCIEINLLLDQKVEREVESNDAEESLALARFDLSAAAKDAPDETLRKRFAEIDRYASEASNKVAVAQILIENGFALPALALTNEALAENPNYIDALLVRGQALILVGEIDDGKKDLDKTLELDPINETAKRLLENISK